MPPSLASKFIPSALIDFADPRGEASGSSPRLRHAFGTPRRVLQAHSLTQVRPLLDAVEAESHSGAWCVGYLRYEAAPAFDAALSASALRASWEMPAKVVMKSSTGLRTVLKTPAGAGKVRHRKDTHNGLGRDPSHPTIRAPHIQARL